MTSRTLTETIHYAVGDIVRDNQPTWAHFRVVLTDLYIASVAPPTKYEYTAHPTIPGALRLTIEWQDGRSYKTAVDRALTVDACAWQEEGSVGFIVEAEAKAVRALKRTLLELVLAHDISHWSLTYVYGA